MKKGTPSTHSKFRRWRLVNPGISSPPARSLSRSQCTPRANSSFLQFRIRGLVSISNFVASKTRWERKEKVEIKITALFFRPNIFLAIVPRTIRNTAVYPRTDLDLNSKLEPRKLFLFVYSTNFLSPMSNKFEYGSEIYHYWTSH